MSACCLISWCPVSIKKSYSKGIKSPRQAFDGTKLTDYIAVVMKAKALPCAGLCDGQRRTALPAKCFFQKRDGELALGLQ